MTNPPDPHDPLAPLLDVALVPATAAMLLLALCLLLLAVGLLERINRRDQP
jgi:hypothetical protein